jgi:hypothetical protein
MSKYSDSRVALQKDTVRRLMVMSPNMPLLEMQNQLEQNGLHLFVHYIGKLKNKLLGEQARKMNVVDMKREISSFIETADMFCETM